MPLRALRPFVRLRLVSVQLASCHFSIDLTGSVAQKRVKKGKPLRKNKPKTTTTSAKGKKQETPKANTKKSSTPNSRKVRRSQSTKHTTSSALSNSKRNLHRHHLLESKSRPSMLLLSQNIVLQLSLLSSSLDVDPQSQH